jgi:hypothetical protein
MKSDIMVKFCLGGGGTFLSTLTFPLLSLPSHSNRFPVASNPFALPLPLPGRVSFRKNLLFYIAVDEFWRILECQKLFGNLGHNVSLMLA